MHISCKHDIHHCVANFMMSYVLFFNYVSIESIYKIKLYSLVASTF